MIRLFGLAMGVCLALSGAIWAARAMGQLRPVPPSLVQLRLFDCALPCWVGIIPGQTTIEQAKARMVAAYSGQTNLQIRDSGFADGYVAPNAVENTIETDHLYLLVRMTFANLIDGKSEIVQSIGLFETQPERSLDPPTVADILGTFGAPPWVAVERSVGSAYEVTLRYPGWMVVFLTRAGRVDLGNNPRIYLGNAPSSAPPSAFRPWRGLVSLRPP